MDTKKIKIKSKDIKKTSKDIEKQLKKDYGIDAVLEAKRSYSTVNGFIKSYMEGAEKVYEVNLYREDKDADFENYAKDGVMYARGNKTTIRKASGIS